MAPLRARFVDVDFRDDEVIAQVYGDEVFFAIWVQTNVEGARAEDPAYAVLTGHTLLIHRSAERFLYSFDRGLADPHCGFVVSPQWFDRVAAARVGCGGLLRAEFVDQLFCPIAHVADSVQADDTSLCEIE